MGQLVKRHKIISITWACPMFILDNFTVALVGKKIEKCDMKFVTETFALCLYETPHYIIYRSMKKGKPLVNLESSGGQHPKYHNGVMSGRIPGDGTFHHHKFI